jgi:hypothetical protein
MGVSRGETFVTYNCTVNQILMAQRDLSLNCQNVNTKFISIKINFIKTEYQFSEN